MRVDPTQVQSTGRKRRIRPLSQMRPFVSATAADKGIRHKNTNIGEGYTLNAAFFWTPCDADCSSEQSYSTFIAPSRCPASISGHLLIFFGQVLAESRPLSAGGGIDGLSACQPFQSQIKCEFKLFIMRQVIV